MCYRQKNDNGCKGLVKKTKSKRQLKNKNEAECNVMLYTGMALLMECSQAECGWSLWCQTL